jgi:hypothetical protein
MPFNLKIRFVGMCVFVPRDGSMFVLLPSTAGLTMAGCCGDGGGAAEDTGGEPAVTAEAGHVHGAAVRARSMEPAMTTGTETPMPQHSARLMFDAGHLHPTDARTLGLRVHETLRGRELVVAGPEHTPARSQMPGAVVQIGTQVKDEAFARTDQNLVVARIELMAGQYYAYAPGHCWNWMGETVRMSHVVEWVIPDLPEPSLSLDFQLLSGATGGGLEPLYPIDGWVNLEVWHVPHAELPPGADTSPAPPLGTPAPHAEAMFRLFDDPPTEIPTYAGDTCLPPVDPGVISNDPDRGSLPYSCMTGVGGP